MIHQILLFNGNQTIELNKILIHGKKNEASYFFFVLSKYTCVISQSPLLENLIIIFYA